jgi:hypothetical protein
VALFGRREKPPAQLLAALEPDERIVSWADTDSGEVVAATTRGLRWPADDGPELIEWHLVARAEWTEHGLILTPSRIDDDVFLVDLPRRRVRLSVPRDLPPTIRKRVEANVVRSERAMIATGAVRFVARRVPGVDGVRWWAWFEPGVRPSADDLAAARARVERLRAEVPKL